MSHPPPEGSAPSGCGKSPASGAAGLQLSSPMSGEGPGPGDAVASPSISFQSIGICRFYTLV